MTNAVSEVGLYGLVRIVAEDRFDAQPAREKEAITQLISEFATRSGDLHDDAMEWFKRTHPWLYSACAEAPPDILQRGPEVGATEVQRIAKRVDEHRSGTLWDDLGFSVVYEDLSRQLFPKQDWKFLQHIDSEVRFAMPASAWREIIEGSEGRLVGDDIALLLERLGVQNPDVRGESRFTLYTRGDLVLHIRPQDAALMMDAMLLRRRGVLLHDDATWIFARRDDLGNGPENCFVMPEEAHLGMRGIKAAVETKSCSIVEATRERLRERGVEDPRPAVVERDGRRCIMLPTDQARVLLRPADPSEAEMSRRRLDYDPRATDYDQNVANLCIQAQNLAYQDHATIEAYARAWGLEGAVLLDNAGTSAQIMIGYDLDRNAIIIAPRGTKERQDIWTDANTRTADVRHLAGKGRAHGGVVEQTDSLLPDFVRTFEEYRSRLREHRATSGLPPQDPAILMGGHSLGGGVAALVLGYFAEKKIKVNSIYTCGQLATFDKEAAGHVAEQVKGNGTVYVRYVNGDDPVPHVPPNCTHGELGFRIYIDEFGRMCPQNRPLPPDSTPPSDGIMSMLKRTIRNLDESVHDHRLGTYMVLVAKAMGSFSCSVWE